MEVYRLLRRAFAGDDPFSGEGSYRFGGRWSSAGTRMSYASTHRSLAVLEYRAHIDLILMPDDLVMATLVIPSDVRIMQADALGKDWRRSPGPEALREIGDRFVAAGEAAVMLVPSVILPEENNALINPKHPDAERMVRVPGLVEFRFDPRLL